MKKTASILIAILTLHSIGTAKNLFYNGNAELGSSGIAHATTSNKDVWSGALAFKLVLKKQASKIFTGFYKTKIDAGKKYHFSVMIKSVGKIPATVSIGFQQYSNTQYSTGKPIVNCIHNQQISEKWSRISSVLSTQTSSKSSTEKQLAEDTKYISLQIILQGKPEETAILLDDIKLSEHATDIHRQIVEKNCELGHALDKAYYDAGTKVDIIRYDLRELEAQGKAISQKTVTSLTKLSRKMRSKWLTLDRKREKLLQSYNRADEELSSTIPEKQAILQNIIEAFALWAKKQANVLDIQTKEQRTGLQYRKTDSDHKLQFNKFITAVDISCKTYGVNRLKYPGNYMNYEYVAKACRALNLNFITTETLNIDRQAFFSAFNSYTNSPCLLWGSNKFFTGGDIVHYSYLGHPKKTYDDINKYMSQYKQFNNIAGFFVDEPTITETSKLRGVLHDNTSIMAAYESYIGSRRIYLEQHGITVPEKPVVDYKNTPESLPLWMEWQLFKANFMASHYQELFNEAAKAGTSMLTLIMNRNNSLPQSTSYVSMGRNVPYISTDLYLNGNIAESFAMQLLKNAASGKAVMMPGSGYSCKTADSFKRSMAIGLAHADGVHMWTYCFLSKYRDPNLYWRYGGKKVNCDDRGRLFLQNWQPEYWDITKKMFSLMNKASHAITNRKSIHSTAILVSERSLIAYQSKHYTQQYWDNCLGVYWDVSATGTPTDVCFMENMNEAKLKQYKCVIIPDAATLTKAEVDLLEQWVKAGGILVSCGNISLNDEWGRPQTNFALSAILGADFQGTQSGNTTFTAQGEQCIYPSSETSLKIKPHTGSIVSSWAKGNPAMISNQYGKGTSYYFSARKLGLRDTSHPKPFNSSTYTPKGFINIINTINSKNKLPISITELPYAIETSIQNSNNTYLVHLIDYSNTPRSIHNAKLTINLPGNWQLIYPENNTSETIESGQKINIKKFRVYCLIKLKKIHQNKTE